MKVRDDFVLREVAGTYVVIPIGDATINFDGMVTLNTSGKMLWKLLETETTIDKLVESLTAEYAVSQVEARQDVQVFLETLRSAGCIEE